MKKNLPVILIVIAALVVLGIFVYQYFQSRESVKVADAVRQERQQWKEKTAALEDKVAALQQEILQQLQPPVSEERVTEALGETAVSEDPNNIPRVDDCRSIEKRIRAFFAYLDNQTYIREAELSGGSYGFFQAATANIAAHRPLIAEETRDLLSLFRNVAHFFRVLGKDRVLLVREILTRESDVLEPAMASFYAWHKMRGRCKISLQGMPNLPVLYNYAGFFLQTLGGRSYFSRRDPVIRTVAAYYCVLILDEANQKKINIDGIDIRPFIEMSMREISGHRDLVYREHYLETLEALQERYRM